jgi:hypothetical protein
MIKKKKQLSGHIIFDKSAKRLWQTLAACGLEEQNL